MAQNVMVNGLICDRCEVEEDEVWVPKNGYWEEDEVLELM